MHIIQEKWSEILNMIKVEHDVSDISFSTWLKPLKVYKVEGNVVTININNQNIALDYINKKYLLPLKVAIAEATGENFEISFILPDEIEEEIKEKAVANPIDHNENIAKANLNPRYTFDTFVVGNNNKMAHAASVAVAESPGESYNPLFIYGGVGLGKTHLMHSIAHYVLQQNSDAKVLYVTSEYFTNELIESIRNGNNSTMSKFREKYRNIDVLLIDDIQFIIGKESTQEEFFHTFNHLHVAGKQIIISSDKPPKDIETLEARLRTRFEWGLIADISAPDYETRMAILKKKIESDQLERYHIPEDVLQFIATNIKSNIRELEGSLNKLIALYKLKNEEINISLAAEALKDLISPDENRKITPELIIETVSEHFGISVSDLKSASRDAKTTNARHIAMYLCRAMTDTPLKTVGSLLGGRDHSTVKHGVDKMSKDMENNDSLKNTISIIQKKISPL